MSGTNLTLREEVLLLSLDDKKGSYLNGTVIQFGVAGAALMELAARGRVELTEGFLVPTDAGRTGDPILDEILTLMTEAKRRKKAKGWVTAIPGKLKGLHHRVAQGLVDRGILKETEAKLLGLFPVKRFPERTPVAEREIRDRIRRAVTGSRRVDERTGPLVALVAACKLTARIYERDRRREAGRRMKDLLKSEAYRRVVGETVREIHGAVVAVVAASKN